MRIIGGPRRPRCLAGLAAVAMLVNLVAVGFLVPYYFDGFPAGYAASAGETVATQEPTLEAIDLSTLNVRMSTQAIHPPEDAVQRTVVLPRLRRARPLYGEPARAAILEDDARRRVVILSAGEEAGPDAVLRAYLLHDFEIERYLPALTACAGTRQCAVDRNPATGGLACIAVCLVEVLRS